MIKLFLTVVAFCSLSVAQSWAPVLSSSRAIDWTKAGLPGTFPDSETSANPWTPPVRSQCVTSQCNTVAGGTVTAASIGAALVSAPAGTYVLIPSTSGCVVINNTNIPLYVANGGNVSAETTGSGGVTLRGSGPQSTCLELTGSSQIQGGIAWNNGSCTWASGFSAGTTSVTLTGCNIAPIVGMVLAFVQCDAGYTGTPCAGTAPVDNGALFVCGDNTTNIVGSSNPCQTDSPSSGPYQHQQQDVYVSGVTGTCTGVSTCTVTFSPGLYMPNWTSAQTTLATFITSSSSGGTITASGNGLEDMTVYAPTSSTANDAVDIGPAYASWVKGVRFIGTGTVNPLFLGPCKNCLVMSNYFFPDPQLDANFPAPMAMAQTSDTLVINNITASGVPWAGENNNVGNVLAFNYGRDTFTMYFENRFFEHHAYSSFENSEGNQIAGQIEDDTWGTCDLQTRFRNYWSGWDPSYYGAQNPYVPRAAQDDAYCRFINYVGNAFGSSLLTTYQGASDVGTVYDINQQSRDSLVATTMMRWGNCDTVTATCRFQSSEVPTTLTGNAVPFENTVPANHSLPCSMFLVSYPSTSCGPLYGGGTGLDFWKVVTSWTTFPTVPATTQIQPFPIAGPDIIGGPYVNGTAYDTPAAIAWQNLPIDTTYQNSYTIASSAWSNVSGTCSPAPAPCEILTFNSAVLPNVTHLMGPFQLSGANAACSTGATFGANSEILIENSSTTTVVYALASNPGVSCTGTMKFPDVRQFDERVYENDPLQTAFPSGIVGGGFSNAAIN